MVKIMMKETREHIKYIETKGTIEASLERIQLAAIELIDNINSILSIDVKKGA